LGDCAVLSFIFRTKAWRCATPSDLRKTGATGLRTSCPAAQMRRARLEKQQLAYFSFVHAIAHGAHIAAE
jgi:hypothetical protein